MVRVKVSQLTFSTHDASVLTLPPAVVGEPCCQLTDGPPGLGPTVPVDAVGVAMVSTSATVQSKPRLQIKKIAPSAARPGLGCARAVFIRSVSFHCHSVGTSE